MNESEIIGYSREYLIKEEKFELIDESLKEKFRSAVEKSFGIAKLDDIGIIYRIHNNKPYEAFVRVYAYTKSMSFKALESLKKSYPNAFIDYVRTQPKYKTLKITIVIANVWLEEESK